ncbi:MAG: efflux RND transporter periplasmic adaptor subunit [Thermoguttaceae bacterium]
MRTVFVALAMIVTIAGGATYYAKHFVAESPVVFRTATVKRGEILSTISATGTLEPEDLINVGTQVAGLIVKFGDDPNSPNGLVDFGSVVEKDALLAKIDPTPYEAALEEAEATLERSEADLLQLEAKCEQTEMEWKRAQDLRPKKAIADTDYDTTKANYKSALAGLAVGKATIRQNKAALRMAKVNLGYTTIKSPVRGTILARRVNIGQTVVASLNAPSLFLIAKDLRRMEVWASVNEADIGQIHKGMPVTFTVDTFPGETFRGTVTQIRMNVTMTQNIVTYTVVVTTDNSNGKLLPYLTASARFEIEHRSNVLKAPRAALRWKPQSSQIDPKVRDEVEAHPAPADEAHGRLWVMTGDGFVRPLDVVEGINDDTMAEVSGKDVREGMSVVLGDAAPEELSGGGQHAETVGGSEGKTSSPFMPTPPKGSRPPPGPPM